MLYYDENERNISKKLILKVLKSGKGELD